jgi:hypothetical protein
MLPSKGFDTPFLESPDTLETQRTEHPFSFQTSKDKQLNAVIVDAINRMGGWATMRRRTTDGRWSHSRNGAQVFWTSSWRNTTISPRDRYLDRWSLVQLIVELRYPEAVKPLNRIIAARIPAEKFRKSYDTSTVAETRRRPKSKK